MKSDVSNLISSENDYNCENTDVFNDLLINNIIEIDKSNLKKLNYNISEFQKGIDSMSDICGKITALVNTGVSPDAALNYITEITINKEASDMNIEISKINANSNIEASKHASNFMSRMNF